MIVVPKVRVNGLTGEESFPYDRSFHAQLCLLIMLFTAQAAVNTRKPGKSRSIRYFAN